MIRAFRLGTGGLNPILDYLAACDLPEVNIQAVLIDAYDPQLYGGTGETADWQQLASERSALKDLPLILAGGLNETKRGAGDHEVRPDAVDTASGVEERPGSKDRNRVEAFLHSAHKAFSLLAS